MNHDAKLSLMVLLLVCLNACHPNVELTPKENPMKILLHQKRWQLIAMTATEENDMVPQDWYIGLPDCIKDNVFITEAPGTGTVGELGAEEGALRCSSDDLLYHPHIAGWKLSDTKDIFSLTLFDTGHRMLYGYALEESYHTENWQLEILDQQTWHVRVDKVRDGIPYEVIMRFQALP